MENSEEIHSAIQTAIAAVQEIYKDEEISNLEVEEIEQEPRTPQREDHGDWLVTVGFDRQKPRTVLGSLVIPQRTLKVVRVHPYTGKFISMKNRNPNT